MNWILRGAAAGLLVALGLAHLVGGIDSSQVWVSVGLLVLTLGVLFMRERHVEAVLRRLSKVSVGPLALELAVAAEQAAATTQPDEEDDGASSSAFELRMRLEMKLTYLAKHVLVLSSEPAQTATYVTVGSLRHDKYLTPEQAELADAILTGRFPQLPIALGASRQLALANTFVKGFRATVFHALVGELLRRAAMTVESADRVGRSRSHLLVVGPQQQVPSRLVPVFSTSRAADSLGERSVRRLRAGRFDDAVVVVPRLDDGSDEERGRGVWTLGHLRTVLGSTI